MSHYEEMGELRNRIARLERYLKDISELPSGEHNGQGADYIFILNGYERAVALAREALDNSAKV